MVQELENEYSSKASELSCWQALLETAGWKKLMTIAEGQMNVRMATVLRTPLASIDSCLGQEYSKGEISGIELFSKLPEVQIEVLKQELETLNKEIENETEVDVTSRSRIDSDVGRDLIDGGDADNPGNDAFGGGAILGAP